MATLEEQFKWLKEVLVEKDGIISDFLKDDISIYLDIEEINSEDLEDLLSKKFKTFITCENKEDVKEFVSRIVGYLIMHQSNEELIADYLAVNSAVPIKIRY